MQKQTDKLSKRVRIVNTLGLHARAAAQIAQIARKAQFGVTVAKNDLKADASSIIDILTLNGSKGSTLTFEIERPSDHKILDELVVLVENGFGE